MAQGKVRIIGGEWRGRKLTVPDVPNLRPTPDRVRETVFNWLSPHIAGAICLDAFAGSGALGFEALSRGASSVVFVDEAGEVVKLLQEELNFFKAQNAEVYRANLPKQLKIPAKPFDIVFLDPPYMSGLLAESCFYLEENHFLSAGAFIYLESREAVEEKILPQNWKIIKSKVAGQVVYQLAIRE
jgi:16S rRNA (guanine966-N2)-methyltransferase